MPTLCAFDWRHYAVLATLTPDPDRGVRVALSHGPDEVVLHLSWESLDALTFAGLTCLRPTGTPAWNPAWLSCL
jgi:hypothetical protein